MGDGPMDDVLVFHNPACSKSRGALEILRERQVEADVVEYLKAPPDRAALERIVDAVAGEPSALVRKDKRFEELALDRERYATRSEVIELLLKHPELMERPVVFVGDRAVIARPPERLLELLD